MVADQVDRHIDTAVSRLPAALSPVAIYLYGSHAYGTPHPGSDIDLLVVVESKGKLIHAA
jgi:predicted nucleotidyltransferase